MKAHEEITPLKDSLHYDETWKQIHHDALEEMDTQDLDIGTVLTQLCHLVSKGIKK